MGIFNLFGAKKGAGTRTKTLVVLDWEKAKSHIANFDFLKDFPNAVVWAFTKNHLKDEKLSKIQHVQVAQPVNVRSLAHYLNNAIIFEIGNNPVYKKIVIVGGDFGYGSTIEFLKQKGIEAQEILLANMKGRGNERGRDTRRDDSRGERGQDRRNDRDGRDRGDGRDRDVRGEREPRGERPDRGERAPRAPLDPEAFEKDMRQILGQFVKRYEVGQVYKKSFFGMIIKQATGSTVQDVFRTRNAKLFIYALINDGVLVEEDSQHFKVAKHPTLEMMLALNPIERKKRYEQEAAQNGEPGAEGSQPRGNNNRGNRGGGRTWRDRNDNRPDNRGENRNGDRPERRPMATSDAEKSELERDADALIEKYETVEPSN